MSPRLNPRSFQLLGIVMLLIVLTLFPSSVVAEDTPLWLRYPSISPDGSTIVFSHGGDLYRVSSTGGNAVPLTFHESYDFMPVWSHDGRWIAFASDRHGNFDVFIIPSGGGEARRLTYHSSGDYPSDFTIDDKNVIFSSTRLDAASSVQFPSGAMSELYSVSVNGGLPTQLISTPAINARFNSDGSVLAYQDKKGFEDKWRKHHTSSITRDLWLYTMSSGKHLRITDFQGEDRNPIWASGDSEIYFLSERNGSINIWKMDAVPGADAIQVTTHEKHPVRFLSMSNDGDMCYGFNGEIYIRPDGSTESRKVDITMSADYRYNTREYKRLSGNVSEMALSPNGKEIAFVIRGEVFVTSIDHESTKRITDTPEQERMISFSPDGRTILYSGERDGSWNVYKSTIASDDEPYFFNATLLKEETVAATDLDEFQAKFSPDGEEIAYLEERTTLKVVNLKSGNRRVIMPGTVNYSYVDGDQWYEWSPDGKWFLVEFFDRGRWSSEVGLIDYKGEKDIVNLTNNGYEDAMPRWLMDGEVMVWFSDRYGMRRHSGWGSNDDVMAMFFTEESWNKFNMSEAELEIAEKTEDGDDDDDENGDDESKDDKDKNDKDKDKDKDKKKNKFFTPDPLPDPVSINLTNIEDRIKRLTIHSSRLADAMLTPDGETLLYLARFEKGYDLWKYSHRKSEIKLLAKLNAKRISKMEMSKDGKSVFVLADGSMKKIEVGGGDQKPISYSADMFLDAAAERAYMFDHIWRQVTKKFYSVDLHGVDWKFYVENYRRFLPFINNNRDFAEMVSEMLGELNGSHTGSGYVPSHPDADATAFLAVFFDPDYEGAGLRILEIIDKSPLIQPDSKIKEGTIIKAIDGTAITSGLNYHPLLNRKAGKNVLLTLSDGKDEWTETVKPISFRRQSQLLYERWIESRRLETERLSNGRLGYVHVRGMDDWSFRESFGEILGRFADREALIIDTRFNGGGNLVEALTTFLSGKVYAYNVPRGQKVGEEPWGKWNRPSIVIMGEANYSDAHCFPAAYSDLEIGELVGMPVPGTCTSVWWESLQDRTLYFGIPQVGLQDASGKFLENNQLYPDYEVDNEPEVVVNGRDQQLEKAVEVMLRQLDSK